MYKCNGIEFTTNRPKVSGYYYVIWYEGCKPMPAWIDYHPKGTILDDKDYWTWGFFKNDDPESLELDIDEPDKIMFSELIINNKLYV